MYVYIRSEPGLWTVGFYNPDGKWHPDSDHDEREKAAERVHWLNGGASTRTLGRLESKLENVERRLSELEGFLDDQRAEDDATYNRTVEEGLRNARR